MSAKFWRMRALTLSTLLLIPSMCWAQFPTDYLFGDDVTGTDFTIAGWFNASQVQTTDTALISNKNWGSGSNVGYVFTVDSDGAANRWKLNANGTGGPRIDSDWTPAALNQWYYMAATFDRNGLVTAYVDGTAVANPDAIPTGSMDTAASPFFLDFNIGQDGTGDYAGGQGFQGLVDDVAIWRRALDPTELAGIASASGSLSTLFGTSLNGGANLVNDSLVGYYAFEQNLNDGAGTPQNGIARTAPSNPGGAIAYASGRTGFGNALSLDGSAYVTIGDAIPPASANFTGNSAVNNLASNPANWDLDPAFLTIDQGIVIATGTTSVFSGANTGPAVFNDSWPPVEVKNLQAGASGQTTYITFEAGANLITAGADDSILGVADSVVNISMTGDGRFEHRGEGEEGSQLTIGQEGSTVNITMGGTSELAAGPKVADAAYATGFRRPLSTDPPGTPPRTGDDIFLGDNNDADLSTVNVTMNQDSVIFAPDVFYPGDSNNTLITVVQNGNSQVIANWDTRWLDDDGGDVVWTMNGNSKFLVARDHGLGETGGAGSINLTVNDLAEFYAGDRIVLGAGGGQINVTVHSGLMKVGGDDPGQVILVDPTGDPIPGQESVARDWILHMGGGATAHLTVNGGSVEVGRSAYIGRGGGQATVVVDGGNFLVKGVGPLGSGLGNDPGGGVPSDVDWQSHGGDLIVGDDQGDTGIFEFRRGVVDVERDVVVSFDNDFGGGGGEGTLRLRSATDPTESGRFDVGRDLSFAGDFFASSAGTAHLEVVLDGADLVPVTVAGDVYIYNDGTSISDFAVSLAPGGMAPAVGQYVLIEYGGSRQGGGVFTELPANGLTYDLIYDDMNGRIVLDVLSVSTQRGDFNNDGLFNCDDINALSAAISGGSTNLTFDMNGDGIVTLADITDAGTGWLAVGGANNPTQTGGNAFLNGDANLSGGVDGSDFGAWNSNKFASNNAWCSGDFNADGSIDGSDFGVWNANKFMSSASASTVPESTTMFSALAACAGLLLTRRQLTK